MKRHRRHGVHIESPDSHGHSHSGEDMLSVEDAFNRVMASFGPLEPVEIPVMDSLGQVLAADITSPLALPPLANSGMDGYAVRAEDIARASTDSPRNLSVIGIVAAGQMPDRPVAAGTRCRYPGRAYAPIAMFST